ncbi:MAG: bifunctional UDP-N-acetylglucosamine diphosphorylase/glucosamine-1-phosphate N-acetyltransferase GlmU [Caulobacteraceae bacterium]
MARRMKRAAVILAAGKGERMASPTPKVLHRIGERAMLDCAIDLAEALGASPIVVVAGRDAAAVKAAAEARLTRGKGKVAIQSEPLGTGLAVLSAADALRGFEGDVLVTYADVPLLEAGDLEPLFEARSAGADLAVLGFEAAEPGAYGRLVMGDDGALDAIVEARDASAEILALNACNSGVLVADRDLLFDLLAKVAPNNAKGEYYLTDVVTLGVKAGRRAAVAFVPEVAARGVNSQAELAAAEAAFQARACARLMASGVTLIDPRTVHLAWDTKLAPGAVIEPFVVFGPGVAVSTGARIRAFSHLEGASVASGALVGPFARLRPGAAIGEDAHIGNFVEVKKVKVGKGAKANHLAYLGDGSVGPGANIGAGTIFCNYDGFDKYDTHVEENAFIGSNSALVAPVRIGKGAYTGSGSVITRDVPADALALGRGTQAEKPGWAAAFRTRKMREKGRKA